MNFMTSLGSSSISDERYENGDFRTVVFSVRTEDEVFADFRSAFEGVEKGYAEISFITSDLLWRILTAKRWDILTVMAGGGEMSIREVARKVDRDVKAVHGDVTSLIKNGIVKRGESGKVIFPYDWFHLNLSNRRAAA